MLNFIIDAYRAIPLRPHCKTRNGIRVHTILCAMIMPALQERHPGGRTCRD